MSTYRPLQVFRFGKGPEIDEVDDDVITMLNEILVKEGAKLVRGRIVVKYSNPEKCLWFETKISPEAHKVRDRVRSVLFQLAEAQENPEASKMLKKLANYTR